MQERTLTVNVSGDGSVGGPPISCPGTCQASYPQGSVGHAHRDSELRGDVRRLGRRLLRDVVAVLGDDELRPDA